MATGWSADGQAPEYLAATRMATLSADVVRTILSRLRIEPGMRVLDVGCGSGEYIFRLGQQTEGIHFVGADLDPAFIEVANARVAGQASELFEPANPVNTYEFACANGLHLPFADDAFDAVISHTYLTAVPDYMAALAEMCRVCKPGGQVSSVTALGGVGGFGRIAFLPKTMSADDAALAQRIVAFLDENFPVMNLTPGLPTHKPQRAFGWIGLEQVTTAPLGQYFCLSDAALSADDYRRHVELLYRLELQGAARGRAADASGAPTAAEWDAYEDLLSRRRQQLLDMCGANPEWDWFASAALLVCGDVPADGEMPVAASMAAGVSVGETARQAAAAAGITADEDYLQAGPGRVCKVSLTCENGATATAWGMTPPQALEEAYGLLLGDEEPVVADLDTAELTPVPDAEAFAVDLVWETVAEAAEDGCAIEFSFVPGCPGAVVCCCTTAEGATRAAAVHEDFGCALGRALARCVGQAFTQGAAR